MKKAKVGVVLLSVVLLAGCGHFHSWQDASCTSPRTCVKCGETEGEALGHTTDFGVCERCGESVGADEFDDAVSSTIGAEVFYHLALEKIENVGTIDPNDAVRFINNECNPQLRRFKEKIQDAAEACGDNPNLADYKQALLDTADAVPSDVASSSDANSWIDEMEDLVYQCYSYREEEIKIYDELGIETRDYGDY